MKALLLLPISLFFLIDKLQANVFDKWVLELEREGVRVYTQLDASSPYKQIKVTTTINATAEQVMNILLAFSQYKNWMNHVTESYLINQSDPMTYYVFTLEDAVWPMQNRYQVSRLDVDQSAAVSTIHFRSVPDYIEKRTDAIQIKKYEGYWSLRDRPNHQCSIEYVLIQHPGGHVPPWLANFHATDNPFHSVAKLKQLAEVHSIRP